MAAQPQALPSAVYKRIYVAIGAALESLGPSVAGKVRNLTEPATLWAIAVLLGRRAFSAEAPLAEYQAAQKALGFLGASPFMDRLGALLVQVGNADDDTEFDAAAAQLQQGLRQVGVDLLTAFLTPTRLGGFRQTAATIMPRPQNLPTRQSLFESAVEVLPPGAMPLTRPLVTAPAAERATQPAPRSAAVTALMYGVPVVGGLVLLLGSYRLITQGKRGCLTT